MGIADLNLISGIDPLLMLKQSAQTAGAFAQTTAGLLTVVLDAGLPYRLAAPLTALLCLAIFTPSSGAIAIDRSFQWF